MHSKVASQLVHVSSHVVQCVTGAVRVQLFSVLHSGQFNNMVKPSPTSVGSFCSGSIRSSFPLKVRRQLQSKPRTAPPKTLSGNSKRRGTAQRHSKKARIALGCHRRPGGWFVCRLATSRGDPREECRGRQFAVGKAAFSAWPIRHQSVYFIANAPSVTCPDPRRPRG